MAEHRPRSVFAAIALAIVGAPACASSEQPSAAATSSGAGGAPTGAGGAGGAGGDSFAGSGGHGGSADCYCAPGLHNDRIFVLSDDAELWTYDPVSNAFELVAPVPCGGGSAFSMAVDPLGRAWVLFADTHAIATLDLASPAACDDPGYTKDQEGFGLFGMAFSSASAIDACAKLYVHSYSGAGPFGEGKDAGRLGVIDPATGQLTPIGPIDYDGGELAGTGDGRLFAFAGVAPAKLVEYDKATAKPVATTPLGLEKTNASAFAFFAGDIYFFTEAPPAGCADCLTASCAADYSSCIADPACNSGLECAIAQGDITDTCGGGMPTAMQNCLFGCAACFPQPEDRVSRVTRMDHDSSEGPGQALTVVVDAAPIRIVGAGASPCVPVVPR